MLAQPPYVSMPNSVEFMQDTNYLGGPNINPYSKNRTLNTVEVAHLHHAIQWIITGVQMIIGFAQSAK